MQHDERVLEGLGKRDTVTRRNHMPRWRDHDQPVGTVRQELHVGAFDQVRDDAYLDLDHSGGPYQDQTYVHNVAMEVTTDAADVCVSLRFQWRPDGLTPVDSATSPS